MFYLIMLDCSLFFSSYFQMTFRDLDLGQIFMSF